MTDLPVDQETRDRALSPLESFHLEAPAGSGKTSVLLARFLTFLGQVEAPEEMLALTFTRKAAGELRARVMKLLWSRKDPGPEAGPLELQLQELAQRAFRRHADGLQLKLTPERLPIMTFHSFCAFLLRSAPQEAGVPLDFRLLEDREAEWLRNEALEEMRRRLSARPAADPVRRSLVRRLVRLNNDWPRLAHELRSLLARRDSLREFLALARHSREPGAYRDLLTERFRLLLEPALKELRAGLAASDLGGDWQNFCQQLQGSPRGENLPAGLPGASPADLPQWQALAETLLTQKGEFRKKLDPNYGFPAGFQKTRWPETVRNLPPDLAPLLKQCRELTLTATLPEEVSALQDLVILMGETLAVYEELCAQRRSLDFIALEEAALGLLQVEDPGEVMLRLDWRLTHLLVDEFQDTSEAQMVLLCRLLAGWEAGRGRTLLVVGDPKQSIYGWRQAKVRLFIESRQGLPCNGAGSWPLTPLRLTTNFRASRTLIGWANEVFGKTIMAPSRASEGVEFHAAAPAPGAPAGAPPYLVLFSGEDDAAAREAEARWLARQVALAVSHRAAAETIGILLFTRTHLPAYLKALKEAGLSVKVREGLKLSESRVVRHLHNLARALVRPQDEVAWAALLRGPWSRQSFDSLIRVVAAPGETWPEKLRRFAADGAGSLYLSGLLPPLTAALAYVGRRPLAEILRQWLEEAGAWPGIPSWEGPPGVANARAYLDLLAEAESGLPEATFLKADFNLEEAYQPPDPRAQDSPVEVLTVHGAKGLEFDQVFLPFMDWQPLKSESNSPPFLLEEIPGARPLRHGLALARPYVQEKQSSLYLLLKNLKDRRVLDEARRVFYVAVTRARKRLVLSGLVKGDKKGIQASPSKESPLGWLWQHYGPAGLIPGVPALWREPDLQVEHFTQIPALEAEAVQSWELPPPWEVEPEAVPYRREFPSQLAEVDLEAGTLAGAAEGETARLRGEVTHRLLETLARGDRLPEAKAVAAALRHEGLAPEVAAKLAPEILAEVTACRSEAFLAPLLSPHVPAAWNEWLLEDQQAPGTIRRGKIDRLVFDGKNWWLLDYKTSRPPQEEAWEEFIAQETEKYRPQLLAYREMAARAKGLEPSETIRLVLYFTGCRRAVVF